MFVLLFKGMVRPHIEYGNQVWAPYLKKQVESIENIQRRATKLVPRLYNMSYKERLEKLKLPTLAFRRLRGDIIEMYKLLHPTVGHDKSLDHFVPLNQGTTRGHTLKIYHTQSRLNIRKNFFTNRVAKIWNDLPEEVVMAPNVMQLEKKLDSFWEGQPMIYDYEAAYVFQRKYTEGQDEEMELEVTDEEKD